MLTDAKEHGRETLRPQREEAPAGTADRPPKSFKLILLEASAKFVHLPPEQVDSEIEALLQSVCTFLGLERSTVWQVFPDALGQWRLTHLYQHPDCATLLEKEDGEIVPRNGWDPTQYPDFFAYKMVVESRELFPCCSRRIGAGEMCVVDSLDDLPKAAKKDRQSYLQTGDKSILALPLQDGGNVIGVVSFNMISQERAWTRLLIEDLALISQILGNAINRKRADLELRRSRARLDLAAAAARAGLWSIENRTRRFWTNDICYEIFGLDKTEELTWERFIGLIQPEDRPKVEAAYLASASGEDVRVEYRHAGADGQVHWCASQGRQHFDAAGQPDFLMGVTLDITERKALDQKLFEQMEEIRRLRDHYHERTLILREEVGASRPPEELLGISAAINQVKLAIGQVAPLETTVLIQGETGTGKSLAAVVIHDRSRRRGHPMVTVHCGALPFNLIESELFGRELDAVGGGDQARLGRFEIASGSTLFLDEVEELPLGVQAKLLRVLQTGEFERLGSSRTLRADVRIIASTCRDLEKEVLEGRFRADLLYRLHVFPITMPPLAQRREDIPLLVQALLGKFAQRFGRPVGSFAPATLRLLQDRAWPGNVRELENLVERSVVLSNGPELKLAGLNGAQGAPPAPMPEAVQAARPGTAPAREPGKTLEEIEREHILATLQALWWRVEGPGGAAEALGLNPSTLRARMRKLGIRRERGLRRASASATPAG